MRWVKEVRMLSYMLRFDLSFPLPVQELAGCIMLHLGRLMIHNTNFGMNGSKVSGYVAVRKLIAIIFAAYTFANRMEFYLKLQPTAQASA